MSHKNDSLSSLELLFASVRDGDVKSVRHWLCEEQNQYHSNRIVDPNTKRTLLDVATRLGRPAIVEYLLNEYGSDFLQKDSEGEWIGHEYWTGKRRLDVTAHLLLETW